MSITSIKDKVSARVAAGAVGVAMIVSLGLGVATQAYAAGLTSSQVQSILSLLQSFGADQATINNVQAALTGQPTTGGSSSTGSSSSSCSTFTRDLTMGSTGSDVMALQAFLNANGTPVAASGVGSAGHESSYFGGMTRAALAKFQAAHAISPAAGYFGPLTRAAVASMCGNGSNGGSNGGSTTPTGPGVTVSAATQPSATLAPQGASRVPFTTFTLTNNTSNPVTINSVTVQRTGLANDADFSGVVLVDSNGAQVGISHTFNSNHQANIGDNFTLGAGQSMTFTVAGNMAASLAAHAGEVAQISVVGVNTSVPVTGSFPITGAAQTTNATLSIGSVSTSTSSYDPGADQNKNIGDTGVRFSGTRFTAGSNEDLKLMSVRWRQVGTASASDISNVVTVVNGTSYPTTVDSTGRYYTTTFPGGVTITKGNSVDVYVQGDLTGSNSASRTVEMDIDKVTDVYFVGQLYGYGIAPAGTYTPWYKGHSTTVNGGSATTIGNATEVPAQNVAPGVNNEVLGGFVTDFTGEPVSVTQMVVNYATSTAAVGLITNASIVDSNGSVVAGPVDATYTGSGSKAKFTFSDTVTFPTGRHVYTIEGKIPSGASNNATIQLDTTPSGWTNATGQTSGNSVTISQGNFTMNTMTVKAGALAVSIAPTPVAQTVIAGTQSLTFANVVLDASQSGEDIRLNSLPLTLDNANNSKEGAANKLSTCQIFDGSSALTGGSNVVNPSGTATTSSTAETFTFDNSLTVAKGTVKTLTLKCNLSSAADSNSQFSWSMTSSQISGLAVTGVTSGTSITATGNTDDGQVMTVAGNGSLTATAASTAVAQPSLALVTAGTSGVTMGQVKFHATNEDIKIQKIGLTLANGTYGSKSTGSGGSTNSGQNDVVTAYIYNGSTQVGTVTFTGTTATSTLSTPVTVSKDSDVFLTIKADLASIGNSAAGGIGDTVKVDPLNAQALGLSSSQQINISATAGVKGVQMFKSIPTVAAGSTNSCSNTNSCNGSTQVIKSFTVTADSAGPISVKQMKFDIATSSASLTNAFVKVLDQSGNVSTSTFGVKKTSFASNAPTYTVVGGPVIIPAGQSYTFQLIGDVTPTSNATNWSVTAKLNNDTAAIAGIGSTPGYIGTTTTKADADSNSRFVWSDNATTTAAASDVDWFNGYQVSGLQSGI